MNKHVMKSTPLYMSVRFSVIYPNLIDSTHALLEAGADPRVLSEEPVDLLSTFDAFDIAIF